MPCFFLYVWKKCKEEIMCNDLDYSGQKFNRLTIIKEVEPKIYPTGGQHRRVLCRCECGCEKEYFLHEVVKGRTKSCGCYNKEQKTKYKHKKEDNVHLYAVWSAMLRRCGQKGRCTPREKKDYADRGITVCSEWMNFDSFADWSNSNGYKKGLQIDRINNDGNYEPQNCRWVTCKENCRNRRDNVYYNGELLLEYFEKNNIHNLRWNTFYMRIWKCKLSVEDAISKPLHWRR